eukprot:m.53661 g.53661  ORF g.53661 m.53661 type:complete len:808 (+) comp34274_c0_seq3:72-2495(+)
MADCDDNPRLIERVREETRRWLSSSSPTTEEELRVNIRQALLMTPCEDRFTRFTDFYDLIKDHSLPELTPMASAFGNILKYARNARKYPKRREYRTITMYNGFYKCNVEAFFGEAQRLFEMMGFRAKDGVLRLPEGDVDRERIVELEVDLMFAQEEIKLIYHVLRKFEKHVIKDRMATLISARTKSVETDEGIEALPRHLETLVHLAINKPLPSERQAADVSRDRADAFISEQEGYDEAHFGEQLGRIGSFDRQISEEDILNLPPPMISPSHNARSRLLDSTGSADNLSSSFLQKHKWPADSIEENENESSVSSVYDKAVDEESMFAISPSTPSPLSDMYTEDPVPYSQSSVDINHGNSHLGNSAAVTETCIEPSVPDSPAVKRTVAIESSVESRNESKPAARPRNPVTGPYDQMNARESSRSVTEPVRPIPAPRKLSKEAKKSGVSQSENPTCDTAGTDAQEGPESTPLSHVSLSDQAQHVRPTFDLGNNISVPNRYMESSAPESPAILATVNTESDPFRLMNGKENGGNSGHVTGLARPVPVPRNQSSREEVKNDNVQEQTSLPKSSAVGPTETQDNPEGSPTDDENFVFIPTENTKTTPSIDSQGNAVDENGAVIDDSSVAAASVLSVGSSRSQTSLYQSHTVDPSARHANQSSAHMEEDAEVDRNLDVGSNAHQQSSDFTHEKDEVEKSLQERDGDLVQDHKKRPTHLKMSTTENQKLPGGPVWACPHCTLNNRTLKNVCESCLKSRDFSLDPSPVGVVCPNCSFVLDVKLHDVKANCPQCENPYPLEALNQPEVCKKHETFV